jgi:hypothetical protein
VKKVDEVTSGAVRVYKSISGPVKDLLALLGDDVPEVLPKLSQPDKNNNTDA